MSVDINYVVMKEAELREEIQRVEREKELLSHSLADRNAELQLQISKTSVSCGISRCTDYNLVN